MHRYSFCGAFWDDARDNCKTKTHCVDDHDCPEFEFCWTQTPCDYYATEMPTTYPPLEVPSKKPAIPNPTKKLTESPIGTTPTKKPTRKPTSGPTKEATDYPTYSPSITAKPTDKPMYDANDPSQTFFCGTSWDEADKTCGMRCPSGNSGNCPGKLECWAFTSCKEELGIQMNTTQPSPMVSPTLAVVYVPGYGGAQVPVFGGVNYTLLQPTSSPAPTGSGRPSVVLLLPPAVAARENRQLTSVEKTGLMWRQTVILGWLFLQESSGFLCFPLLWHFFHRNHDSCSSGTF